MKKFIIIIPILALFIILNFSKNKTENYIAVISPIVTSTSTSPSISIYPETILPGNPIIATITSSPAPTEIFFDNKSVPIFIYNEKPTAIMAVKLEEKDLEHNIKVIFESGEITTTPITLTTREKIERPLGIPAKLGGNTPEAGKALVNNLTKENANLNSIETEPTILWSEPFQFPLKNNIVTDDYGYSRGTVGYIITHKGTDFRALEGTDVMAMNRGIVKIARPYVIYGDTIVIDHGLGLQTLYMHLSKINVKEGDMVEKGQVIAQSGKTGYAESPHLHISIKIDGISIDPMKFIEFFDVI